MSNFSTTIGLSKSLNMFDECSNFDGGIKPIYLAKDQKVFSEQPLKSILKKRDSNVKLNRRVEFDLNLKIRYIPNRFNCQDGYTDSRICQPRRNFNGNTRQTVDGRDYYVKEYRSRFNETGHGYFNGINKPNYSRSYCDDTFVLKVDNILNNVRVRDLKGSLADRGVKPLRITWKGHKGFAYLRYAISYGVEKDHIMSSLRKISFKPNGVETTQLHTLIVTECQFQ